MRDASLERRLGATAARVAIVASGVPDPTRKAWGCRHWPGTNRRRSHAATSTPCRYRRDAGRRQPPAVRPSTLATVYFTDGGRPFPTGVTVNALDPGLMPGW